MLNDIESVKVYVKINSNKEIIEIGSSVFIKDLAGWHFVDEGDGDRYVHAQSQYLKKPIKNENGDFNFYLIEGKIQEQI